MTKEHWEIINGIFESVELIMQQHNKELVLAECNKAEHTLHAQQGEDFKGCPK